MRAYPLPRSAESSCRARIQTFAKVSQADAERRRSEAVEDREAAEARLRQAEQRVRELEACLEDEGGDYVKARREAERLQVELEDLRGQYDRALNEREFLGEATRQRFQKELEGFVVRPVLPSQSPYLTIHTSSGRA